MLKITKELFRQALSYIKRDEPALLTFLFHSIFKDEDEIAQKLIDPQQYITVNIYRQFLEIFLNAGYKFVGPDEIKTLPAGKYILSTFDDGYYNNRLILPLLEQYKTPILLFVTTNNVINNKCYWWDVVFRELSKKGLDRKAISKAQGNYKSLTHEQIETALKAEYGEDCFTPRGDIDRPFAVSELKEFSQSDYVFIGNHTSDHYILDHYDRQTQIEQISGCQKDLEEMLNQKITTISYPNGNYNEETISICQDMQFDWGITVDKKKNRFPLQEPLRLGRYVLWGNKSIKRQCDIFCSDMSK